MISKKEFNALLPGSIVELANNGNPINAILVEHNQDGGSSFYIPEMYKSQFPKTHFVKEKRSLFNTEIAMLDKLHLGKGAWKNMTYTEDFGYHKINKIISKNLDYTPFLSVGDIVSIKHSNHSVNKNCTFVGFNSKNRPLFYAPKSFYSEYDDFTQYLSEDEIIDNLDKLGLDLANGKIYCLNPETYPVYDIKIINHHILKNKSFIDYKIGDEVEFYFDEPKNLKSKKHLVKLKGIITKVDEVDRELYVKISAQDYKKHTTTSEYLDGDILIDLSGINNELHLLMADEIVCSHTPKAKIKKDSKHAFKIIDRENEDNAIKQKEKPKVRKSLEYQGIARRDADKEITYDTDIDTSAVEIEETTKITKSVYDEINNLYTTVEFEKDQIQYFGLNTAKTLQENNIKIGDIVEFKKDHLYFNNGICKAVYLGPYLAVDGLHRAVFYPIDIVPSFAKNNYKDVLPYVRENIKKCGLNDTDNDIFYMNYFPYDDMLSNTDKSYIKPSPLKKEISNALYRVAADQSINIMQNSLSNFTSKNKDIKEILNSDIMNSIMRLSMGYGLALTDISKENEYIGKISSELRQSGLSNAGNLIIQDIVLPALKQILPAINEQSLKDNTKKVRIKKKKPKDKNQLLLENNNDKEILQNQVVI